MVNWRKALFQNRSIVGTHPTGEPISTANRSYAERASAHHGADEPGLGLASPKRDDSPPLVFARCKGILTLAAVLTARTSRFYTYATTQTKHN